MIHTALQLLTSELNDYLDLKNTSIAGETKCVLSNVADESGDWAIPDNKLGLSLINIEEDTTLKEQEPKRVTVNGQVQKVNPVCKINLYVLITANYVSVGDNTTEYLEGLKQLSYAMSFFQGKNVFTPQNTPLLVTLDPSIEVLYVDLHSYSFEQLYNFWSVVGAKYLPSVLYRVRMLRFQDDNILDMNPVITSTNMNLGN